MPANRFLMCEPVFFDVCYVINPWMEGNVHSVSLARSLQQWQELYHEMTARSEVSLVRGEAGLPDMVFTANAGLVADGKVVLSHFLHRERQREEGFFGAWFEAQGYKVYRLPLDTPFEGAGDALLDHEHKVVWAGYGGRSDFASHAYIARWLDLEVISLRLTHPHFYHLDTCFCPLTNGYLLYYPPAFDGESLSSIAKRYPKEKLIAVDDDQAASFSCNAVNIEDLIIVNHISPELERRLSRLGFLVLQTGLSEFIKSGGAAKCLTLKLSEPHPSFGHR